MDTTTRTHVTTYIYYIIIITVYVVLDIIYNIIYKYIHTRIHTYAHILPSVLKYENNLATGHKPNFTNNNDNLHCPGEKYRFLLYLDHGHFLLHLHILHGYLPLNATN